MKDEKKAPKLRFKGFTDDWEQCKLGDVAGIVGGGTPSTKKSEYWNGNINWFTPAEIGNQIFVSHSQKKITELGLLKSSAKILPAGTILFTSRAGIGNTAILTRNACTNQGFQSIVPYSNKLDSYFIYSESAKLKRYGETMGSGSTFTEVSGKQMKKMSLHIPNINEQAKIGNMLKILDRTITLHEEKKCLLERLKSALLQKMFANKNGYPAVRFEGFDKAWKQSKLGEITKVIASKPYISTPSTHGNYLVIQQGDKPIAGFSNSNPFKNYNNITLFGDHTLSLFKPRSPFLIASDGIKILSPSIEMNGLFYFYELEKYKPKSEGYKRHFTILKKCKANFPTDIDEQKLIGNLLFRIDNLITKQQLKMDKLNETKESLLQNMFI
ncbi:restriction endonuclease subunit S [Lactobacillus delbrueckii subsp. bulgaricus]|nr:hypothetical protein [Lactobacillus delbrueckii subsp. bulgaricus]MBT8963499.1 hypothetical protein [Lactobacillus delbrueckii subsp. bulgaricus]MBT8971160.1 hypothetical protein [Lactobacillus delbrueckii subsp. bulgaricus]